MGRWIAIATLLALLVWWGAWQVYALGLPAPLWEPSSGTQEWLPLSSNTKELLAEAEPTIRESELLAREIVGGSRQLEGVSDADWQAIRQHLAKSEVSSAADAVIADIIRASNGRIPGCAAQYCLSSDDGGGLQPVADVASAALLGLALEFHREEYGAAISNACAQLKAYRLLACNNCTATWALATTTWQLRVLRLLDDEVETLRQRQDVAALHDAQQCLRGLPSGGVRENFPDWFIQDAYALERSVVEDFVRRLRLYPLVQLVYDPQKTMEGVDRCFASVWRQLHEAGDLGEHNTAALRDVFNLVGHRIVKEGCLSAETARDRAERIRRKLAELEALERRLPAATE